MWPDLSKADDAYIFGLLQTDGSHEQGPGNKGRVQLELAAADSDLLHAIRCRIPVYASVTTRCRTTNFAADYQTSTLRFYDRATREHLVRLGLPTGRKSHLVAAPAGPLSQPDYVRGLVDGDGSIGFTATGAPFIGFVTASEALAAYYCETLHAVTGARRQANRNKRDNVFNILVARDPAARFAEWLYYEGALALQRKAAKAELVGTWRRPSTMRTRPVGRRNWSRAEDALLLSLTTTEAVAALGRTAKSVTARRWRLTATP